MVDISSQIQEYLATASEVIANPENYRTFLEEWVGLENSEGVQRTDVSHDDLTTGIVTNVVLQDLFDYAEEASDEVGRQAQIKRRIEKWNALVIRYGLVDCEFRDDPESETAEENFYDHFHEDPGVLSEIAEKILSRDAPGFVAGRKDEIEALIDIYIG